MNNGRTQIRDCFSAKSIITTILVSSLTLTIIPNAIAGDIEGSIRILAGSKQLDSDDWPKLDSQGEFGLLFDIKKETWPVSIAADLMMSGGDGDNPEFEYGYTVEQHLGIRKTWDLQNSKIHPYIGGGVAVIYAGLEQENEAGGKKEDDQGIGGWIGTGAYWSLTESVNLGLDIRYSQADVEMFSKEIKAGGTHAGLTIGYNW